MVGDTSSEAARAGRSGTACGHNGPSPVREDQGASAVPEPGLTAAEPTDSHHTAAITPTEPLRLRGAPPQSGGLSYLPAKETNNLFALPQSCNASAQRPGPGAASQRQLASEIDRVLPGRCIVIFNEDSIPDSDEQLCILSRQRGLPEPVVVDCRKKLKARPTPQAFTALFKEAMLSGRWFFMMKASKSMTLLTQLASLVVEMREHHLEGLHRDARIIVSSEPHPHFPLQLLEGGITLRVHNASSLATLILSSVSNSASVRCLATAEDPDPFFSTPSDCSQQQPSPKRRVRLDPRLVVIHVDPRMPYCSVASLADERRASSVTMIDLFLRNSCTVTFSSALWPDVGPETQHLGSAATPCAMPADAARLPQERFYSIAYADADCDAVAICSSLGNVFVIDGDGAQRYSFHAHDAAVWDVSFGPDGTIVTGGEDGLGVWWGRDAREPDALFCRDVVRVPNDVYAIRHTSSGAAVGLGGYLPYLLVRSAGGVSREVLMSTAVQAIAAVPGSETLLCAGSDGTVTAVDAEAGATLWSASRHVKKCPCVATNGAHTVVSGSYDGTVKVWDARAPQTSSTAAIKFTGAVTGVASSGEYMAACVGQCLHLWDMRNTSQALSSVAQAWKGSSRGIVMDGGSKTVVTASPDGVARFWSFQ